MAQLPAPNYGGNAPSMKRDANKVLYFGVNDPTRKNAFRVTRRLPDGRCEDVALSEPIGGQGRLEQFDDGTLWAVGAATTGNNTPIVYVQIHEFAIATPPAEIWLGELGMVNDGDGKTWQRLNNIRHILTYVLRRLN